VCLFTKSVGSLAKKGTHADPVVDQAEEWEAQPWNFWIFPSSSARDVTLNVETVQWLLKQRMDFGKWIEKGIPYVRMCDAEQRRREFEQSVPHVVTFDQKRLAKLEKNELRDFTDAMAKAQQVADGTSEEPMRSPFFKSRDTFTMFEAYAASLGLVKTVERIGGKPATVFALYDRERERQKTEASIGFTRVVEALSAARKPIVGHNSLMDHLFLRTAFDGRPLPTLKEFKIATVKRFPVIFDTRTLATLPSNSFDASQVQNLEGMHTTMESRHGTKVRVSMPLGFHSYFPAVLSASGAGSHEAAYDALITGRLFLYLRHEIGDGTVESILPHMRLLPVYKCIETVALHKPDGPDVVLHDGPILFLSYPRMAFNCNKVYSLVNETAFEGRVVWNPECAHLFAPPKARGTLFDKDLRAFQERVKKANAEARVSVVRE